MTQPWIGQQMEQETFVTRLDGWTHLQNIPLGKLLLKISLLKKVLFFESDCLYMLVGGILPGGGLLGLLLLGMCRWSLRTPTPL